MPPSLPELPPVPGAAILVSIVLRSIALAGVIVMVACGSGPVDPFSGTAPRASGGGDASASGGSGASTVFGGIATGGATGGTPSEAAGTSGGGVSPGGAASAAGTAGTAGTAGNGGTAGTDGTPDAGVAPVDGGLPPVTCTNGVQDVAETDVDCGGPHCLGCATGSSCSSASDCTNQRCGCATVPFCFGDTCLAPTCFDGLRNGAEGDVDCGGSCVPCATGASCGGDGDCERGPCVVGVCTCTPYTCGDIPDACGNLDDGCAGNVTCPPCITLCTDGKHNVVETDVDCGGPDCSRCPVGKSCSTGADCVTGVCQAALFAGLTCRAAACGDGVRNGDESDVDCGGSCTLCEPGDSCDSDGDCLRGPCQGSVCGCTPRICDDVPSACGELDDQCGSTVTCRPCAELCSDALQDGNETDVDCGGPDCDACASGMSCISGTDCTSGTCSVVGCGPFCTTQQCTG